MEAAVLKELATVEAMRAQLGSQPLRPLDAERTARTLNSLTETLAKLKRLRVGLPAQAVSHEDDDVPEDIDEFRFELARRLEAFFKSRTEAAGVEAISAPTAAQG
jgi:hypothetical protein